MLMYWTFCLHTYTMINAFSIFNKFWLDNSLIPIQGVSLVWQAMQSLITKAIFFLNPGKKRILKILYVHLVRNNQKLQPVRSVICSEQ